MKLLFDENFSPLLVALLEDLFPDSTHILTVAGPGLADNLVWALARDNDYAIVSKDNDFRQRSFLEGSPPKIVWLSVGNAGTALIALLLRQRYADLIRFNDDAGSSLLVVTE